MRDPDGEFLLSYYWLSGIKRHGDFEDGIIRDLIHEEIG